MRKKNPYLVRGTNGGPVYREANMRDARAKARELAGQWTHLLFQENIEGEPFGVHVWAIDLERVPPIVRIAEIYV